MSAETVFSVLTPTGRGAVAVVAVAGPQASGAVDRFFRARNEGSLGAQVLGRIVYGHWGDEDLIVCRRGEEQIEIHCHGGTQSAETISLDLSSAGCVEIDCQAWMVHQGECPIRMSARLALAQATSTRTAVMLLDQFHGALRREIDEIVSLLSSRQTEASERLELLLSTASLGQHLTHPWQVVIAGRPNVGKSSLINALVGYQRAIVFDQPGTTRDVVTAQAVIDGWPVSLSDTAGLHASTDELESAGIELARQRLALADLVVWVVDATQLRSDSLFREVERQADELRLTLPENRLVVINKIDQAAELAIPESAIGTCAISGAGVDGLLSAISGALVPQAPPRGSAVLFSPEQVQAVAPALAACEQGDFRRAADWLASLTCGEKT